MADTIDWDVVIIETVECGCCDLDTAAAQMTLEYIEEMMDYDEVTADARDTIDTVYNAFKWFNQKVISDKEGTE